MELLNYAIKSGLEIEIDIEPKLEGILTAVDCLYSYTKKNYDYLFDKSRGE